MPDGVVYSLARAPPCPLSRRQLRKLVLDYLVKTCALETADAFVREWPDEDDEFDAPLGRDMSGGARDAMHVVTNGDAGPSTNGHAVNGGAGVVSPLSEATRRHTASRREIRRHLLAGRIQTAVDVCTADFPDLLRAPPSASPHAPPLHVSAARSLSTGLSTVMGGLLRSQPAPSKPAAPYKPAEIPEPALLALDLQIQMFIESVRAASTSLASASSLNGAGAAAGDHLTPGADLDDGRSASSTGSTLSYSAFSQALSLAQTLHAQASSLPSPAHRARYLKELENVSGLIAYQNPEESPVRHFLAVERRAELADGIDRAILLLLGCEPRSGIERAVRHNEAIWRQLAHDRVPYPPERGKDKERPAYTTEVPLAAWLDTLHSD